MNTIKLSAALLCMLLMLSVCTNGENIDPYDEGAQYAWSQNAGWLNFEPAAGSGAHAGAGSLTGYIWAENIGWISLSCENTASCAAVNYGVTNDGSGNLSGYAWSENAGWISFSCENTSSCGAVDYGAAIDSQGLLSGYAWGENIGWISFDSTPIPYRVKACVVSLDDLANFAVDWLEMGNPPANLDGSRRVDAGDFAIFSSYWNGYCPDGWKLK
jgi:hypothetical protein